MLTNGLINYEIITEDYPFVLLTIFLALSKIVLKVVASLNVQKTVIKNLIFSKHTGAITSLNKRVLN